ncbi:hypothetical protein EFL02_12555 [Enterococcus faecium]|uniref:hypothetical protein n=1 Tax=Enterococcus TaxID=1350 RepID=UPI0008A58604|nr:MULTISPECIES: hypothetical protein [Enterococcus]EGP4767434.1 hypothetical protein [Enterococcus faecium]EGP4864106.1 hypothetical protein [Enterococcus faecium]EGP5144754.1 hypothetical protein [Enterococcus faecium]EGP5249877.1 hypothetical protein [Enterococcus faecium]EGP5393122.1 hypothetical protein [Enterococcus faecium]
MNRYEILSRFFKKNKRYDFVTKRNENQQQSNAQFQAVGFDVDMDVLKYLRIYEKKYYALRFISEPKDGFSNEKKRLK